eukprot:TRINITY_DN727_c0_g1_i2.p1 TRINITY_DN727_c0_g1~~TRINITY_DN727_c0_g1_i2.p1  ORF type:complete len:249 (+),score=59.74 TRINITY_DN727_c0_g1_i2:39-785(+)
MFARGSQASRGLVSCILNVPRACFASSSSPSAKKVYELRTYDIKPEFFPAFLQLTAKHIHLRTQHSPCLGYWATEIGGINQVVHLWEYDSLDQRAGVRKALGGDKDWNALYMTPMRPMLAKQDNAVMLTFPWGNVLEGLQANKTGSNIYELKTYTVKSGALSAWEQAWAKAFDKRKKYSVSNGVFYSDIGPLSTVTHLWSYPSYAARDASKEAAMQDPEWKEAVHGTQDHILAKFSKILVPTEFSLLR